MGHRSKLIQPKARIVGPFSLQPAGQKAQVTTWTWGRGVTWEVETVVCGIHRCLSGARSRSSARGKGHEEGGLAYAKAGSSPRSPPENSPASTPKPRVCLLSALCSHLHLWLYGGPTTSLWKKKKVNLQLQLIKFLGVMVFQPTNSFGSPLACLNRFFRPHVIAQSLPTVRGMRCSKLSKYRFLWAVKRLIRNCVGEGFFTIWANVCC